MFGVDEIAWLRRHASRVASAFDAALVSAEEALAVVEHAAAIEAMAAAVKAAAARRVAETDLWRARGDRSPAHHLARLTGTSVGRARETLDTASRLASLPAVEAAARRGELSAERAAAIADAAAVAPAAATRLVEAARHASLGELRDECARTKAAALPDAGARHAAVHASRYARRRALPDGAAELTYRSTPEEVAEVWAVVESYADKVFERARAEGRRESFDAYAADGLLAMARAAAGAPAGRRAPSKVIVRVDWDALVRGFPAAGEVCEMPGLGPVPVSVVRAMVESGDAFLAAVVTRGVDVATVAHLGRSPTAHQRTGLQWREPCCVVLGCNQTARLEIDHRADWADTRITLLELLNGLCHHHRALKTRENWRLVEGTGKRPMVAPGHPDHPDRSRRAPPVPAA